MKVGVLALQGAFIEHEKMLSRFGISCVELRQASDLNRSCDGLILPGGESTVQGKLLHDLHTGSCNLCRCDSACLRD